MIIDGLSQVLWWLLMVYEDYWWLILMVNNISTPKSAARYPYLSHDRIPAPKIHRGFDKGSEELPPRTLKVYLGTELKDQVHPSSPSNFFWANSSVNWNTFFNTPVIHRWCCYHVNVPIKLLAFGYIAGNELQVDTPWFHTSLVATRKHHA